jgi:hypothetical protein
MGKPVPKSSVLGIIPEDINLFIGLSETLQSKFQTYIDTLLKILSDLDISIQKREDGMALDAIIEEFRNPMRESL